ncbi:MAG: Tubulin polyglutamylase ttll6, partial [Paramarteilia canceri]
MCCEHSRYDVVRRAAKQAAFKVVGESLPYISNSSSNIDNKWHILWLDAASIFDEKTFDMKRYQKVNHFPGMNEISRKDSLARNLNRMKKLFPEDYNIFPHTWILPAEIFILKPDIGTMGKGIWITNNIDEIRSDHDYVCQKYISNPLLVDGYKFDMRIYVAVSSVDPLRIYTYREGLARFATVEYRKPSINNVDDNFMHLTNYSVNRSSINFIHDEYEGSKRRLSTFLKQLSEEVDISPNEIWSSIDDIIVKVLLSCHSSLKHNYNTFFPCRSEVGSGCFELLGFDIIFDNKMKPYVLEVNKAPSLATDSALDESVKRNLLFDLFKLVSYGLGDRDKIVEKEKKRVKERLLNRKTTLSLSDEQMGEIEEKCRQYELNNLNKFSPCYPVDDESIMNYYRKFLNHKTNLFHETAAYKARAECSRKLREELDRKNKILEKFAKKKAKDKFNCEDEAIESSKISNKKPKRTDSKSFINRNRLAVSRPSITGSIDSETISSHLPIPIVYAEEFERRKLLADREKKLLESGFLECLKRLIYSLNEDVEQKRDLELSCAKKNNFSTYNQTFDQNANRCEKIKIDQNQSEKDDTQIVSGKKLWRYTMLNEVRNSLIENPAQNHCKPKLKNYSILQEALTSKSYYGDLSKKLDDWEINIKEKKLFQNDSIHNTEDINSLIPTIIKINPSRNIKS